MQIIRESILASAFRSLCNAFFGFFGIILAIIAVFSVIGSISSTKVNSPSTDRFQAKLLPDAQGNILPATETDPILLQINIHGAIGKENLTDAHFETLLQKLQDNTLINMDRVKGLFLNIDSRGGCVKSTFAIFQMLKAFKAKYSLPIMAYVDGTCASGGYYLACLADHIECTPISVVGSVGARGGPFVNVQGLSEKYGVRAAYITAGKSKIYMPPFDSWPEQVEEIPGYNSLHNILEKIYDQFVEVVATHRAQQGLTRHLLETKYGAHVFIAEEAKEYGYIDDALATRRSSIEHLANACGLEGTYHVVSLEKQPPLLEQLFENNVNFIQSVLGLQSTQGYNMQYLYDPSLL